MAVIEPWSGRLTRIEAVRILDCATDKDDPFWESVVQDFYDEKADNIPTIMDVLAVLGVTKEEYIEASGADNIDWPTLPHESAVSPPPVSAREEVQAPLNSDGDTLLSLADEIAAAESRSILGMPVVAFTMSAVNRDHIVAALRLPSPSAESIRNAIAAMEELVAETAEHLRNIVEAKTEDFRGLDDPRLRSAYEQETARMEAIVQRGRASLAALKREVAG